MPDWTSGGTIFNSRGYGYTPGVDQEWRGNAYGSPNIPITPSGPGFWSHVGSGLASGIGSVASLGQRGLGLLLNRSGTGTTTPTMGSAPANVGSTGMGTYTGGKGVTQSAGGWKIDANGNLIEGASGGRAPSLDTYSAPWDLARASGASGGQYHGLGFSPAWLVH